MPPVPAATPSGATMSPDLVTVAAAADTANGGSHVTAAATAAFAVGDMLDAAVLPPFPCTDESGDVPPGPGGLASRTALPGSAEYQIDALPDGQPSSDGLIGGFSPAAACLNEAARQWHSGLNEDELCPGALVRHGTDVVNEAPSDRAGCTDERTHTQAEMQCRSHPGLDCGPCIADRHLFSPSETRDVDCRSDGVDALTQNAGVQPSSTKAAPAGSSTFSLQRSDEDKQVNAPTGLRKPVLSFTRPVQRSQPQHGPAGAATNPAYDSRGPAANPASRLAGASTKSAAEISTQPIVPGAFTHIDGRASPHRTSAAEQSAAASAADDAIDDCSDDLESFVDALIDMTDKNSMENPPKHAHKRAPQKSQMNAIGPKLKFMSNVVAANGDQLGEEQCDRDGCFSGLPGSDVVRDPYAPSTKLYCGLSLSDRSLHGSGDESVHCIIMLQYLSYLKVHC